tara:strand:- start:139 stop:1128 length:990 start_codon:yes stop_codon:yes gene_type:complete
MNEPIAHHFVPQHLQCNFSDDPNEQVSVFDVTDGRKFPTGTKVVMQRGHFHTVIGPRGRANFETSMTEIENSVLHTYQSVVAAKHLTLSDEEIGHLSVLVAFQELRTSQFRNQFLNLESQLAEHVAKFGTTLKQVEGYEPFDQETLKANHLIFLSEHLRGFARIISKMNFVLMSPPPGQHLYLGDSPVVRHNDNEAGFWGNLGFASDGLQLYMPLSKDLLLGMWAPDLLHGLRESVADARRLHAQYTLSPQAQVSISNAVGGSDIVVASVEVTRANEKRLRKIASGEPIEMFSDNVHFYNSLQLNSAERHVVCPYGDYDLADRWFAQKA